MVSLIPVTVAIHAAIMEEIWQELADMGSHLVDRPILMGVDMGREDIIVIAPAITSEPWEGRQRPAKDWKDRQYRRPRKRRGR